MAKITLDPKYRDVYGKTGDLVHYKWRGKDCCRIYLVPRNPDTRAQKINRKLFGEASASWRELPVETKNFYNFIVLKEKSDMSGFNLYVSRYMTGRIKKADCEALNAQALPLNSIMPPTSRNSPDPLRMHSMYAQYMFRESLKSLRNRPAGDPGLARAS